MSLLDGVIMKLELEIGIVINLGLTIQIKAIHLITIY